MYKLRYWLVGGTLKTKYFSTLAEATNFAVYKAPFESVHSLDKVEENA